MHTFRMVVVGLIVLSSTAADRAWAQESRSAAEAQKLTALLDQQKLDAIAAKDPERPDRYIGALYYPGSQLLVVSASYPAPASMDYRLGERQYRDAYLDIQGAGAREGRFFVTDLLADGLRAARRGEPFDIIYKDGKDQVAYDGDWRAQKMSESDYQEQFRKDDERYAKMLASLAAAAAAAGGAPAPAAPGPSAPPVPAPGSVPPR